LTSGNEFLQSDGVLILDNWKS